MAGGDGQAFLKNLPDFKKNRPHMKLGQARGRLAMKRQPMAV